MKLEWASIYITYDASIKSVEKAWMWHVVPVSNHLLDTESELAPWDPSKAHILLSTPERLRLRCEFSRSLLDKQGADPDADGSGYHSDSSCFKTL